MIVKIFFDKTGKNFQLIRTARKLECSVADIVSTVTCDEYLYFVIIK